MNKTKIEYLDYTWNPLVMRCTPVSEGCRSCWHLAMCRRLAKNPLINEDERAAYDTEPPILVSTRLEEPLHVKKPSRIGVQFMGDLFHSDISLNFIEEIMTVIKRCQRHTFLILTKRSQRMSDMLETFKLWAFDNLWLGVSVENQRTAYERIPILLQIPAAKRFVSIEPMLGPIDIYPAPMHQKDKCIDWIICGGETGPEARPMHAEWVRFLRDQCQAAGVPFFFKSWGDYEKRIACLLDGRAWREMP